MKKFSKRLMLALVLSMTMLFAMTLTSSAEAGDLGLKQTKAYSTSAYIQWTATAGVKYDVYLSSDGVNVSKLTTNPTSYNTYTVSGLKPGNTYYVQVNGTDGKWDIIVVATTPDGVTTVSQSAATAKSVTIKWNKVTDCDGYVVVDKNNKVMATVKGADKTSAKISQTGGTEKSYYVYTVKGGSTYTAVSSTYKYVYAKSSPFAPLGYGVASSTDWDLAKNSVNAYWKKNTKNTYSISGYQLQIKTVDGKKKLKTYDITSGYSINKKFSIKSIKNKGFKMRMRSYVKLASGKKLYSSWGATKTVIPCAKIKAEKGSSSIKLSWSRISNATKYEVYVLKNSSSSTAKKKQLKRVATIKGTSYTITGVNYSGIHYTHVYVKPTVNIKGKTYKGMVTSWDVFKTYTTYY